MLIKSKNYGRNQKKRKEYSAKQTFAGWSGCEQGKT
jgi:hypothetical protein